MGGESITRLLEQVDAGDRAAFDCLFVQLHAQLREAAHRQLRQCDGSLSTTALVNQTWLKLAPARLQARDRGHFIAIAARAMRMIVVDQARRLHADKRGGGQLRVTLDTGVADDTHDLDELLALDAALQRLAATDARLAQLVEWRYFGGLGDDEVAARLGVSVRTVRRDWRKARAFLYRDMTRGDEA
ncbi:MAG: ECF-type sigma factor [Pseudomonadota bacterium]